MPEIEGGEHQNARRAIERLGERLWNDPKCRERDGLKTPQDAQDKAREIARRRDWEQSNCRGR
ncbi:MAG: hypothetical protein AAFV53_32480 [Myxococcota bacterium]